MLAVIIELPVPQSQAPVSLTIRDKERKYPCLHPDLTVRVLRPVKELKGFDKVTLAPGETRDVTFTVKPDDLKFYDESSKQWVAEPGKFTFIAAPSAGAKGSTATFTLK